MVLLFWKHGVLINTCSEEGGHDVLVCFDNTPRVRIVDTSYN